MRVWKATQKPTLKPREGLHYHKLRHPWTSLPLVRPSNGINRASLMTDTSATHIAESTGCSPAVQPDSSAGNVIGTGTSALRWPSYALAILCCWQAISTGSGAGTPPPVHTGTALTRRQSTWCSGSSSWPGQKRHLAGRSIQHGSTTPLGVPGVDWGGDLPPPQPGMREREREREYRVRQVNVQSVSLWQTVIHHPSLTHTTSSSSSNSSSNNSSSSMTH